jgi:hypothetical protein
MPSKTHCASISCFFAASMASIPCGQVARLDQRGRQMGILMNSFLAPRLASPQSNVALLAMIWRLSRMRQRFRPFDAASQH